MKKTLLLLLTLFTSLLLFGCNGKDQKVELPNLINSNKVQVLEKMENLGLEVNLLDEVNNKVQEGLFSSFGNNLKVGDEVEKGSKVDVYFAIHKNTLPNLTGLTKDEAAREFNYVRFIYTIVEVETTEVEPGKFIGYEGYEIGAELPVDFDVTVYFALRPFPEKHNLLISKYVEGRSSDKGIEIYNSSDKELDLSLFTLAVYRNGSETPSDVFTFDKQTITSKEVIVIVDENSTPEFKAKAHQILALNIDGNDAIAILYRGTVVDVVGHIGMGMMHINDVTLVRDASITENKNTFDIYDWNEYGRDNTSLFGSHPTVYPSSFTLNGSVWLTKDYFTEDGGVVEVTYDGTYDGDTSYFKPHFLGNSRIRYIGINTPEMMDERGAVWRAVAEDAKNFTHSKLVNATVIHIQHDPNTGRKDTYGRNLGLVWYDGTLLNYELVLNGYSQNNYEDPNEIFVYEGIPLTVWFRNAEKHAKLNKLGIWALQ